MDYDESHAILSDFNEAETVDTTSFPSWLTLHLTPAPSSPLVED